MSAKGEAATLSLTLCPDDPLLLIGLALALPAPAAAEDATIVSRDVPLGAQRSLAAGKPTSQFNLVGLHWRGSGTVQFRTRSLAGRWGNWVDAAPEAEDQPDSGTDERARLSSWRLGNPWWVGPSDRIEYRLRGKITRLRAYFVWSPPAGVPARTLQKAGAPAIVPRSGWNADESIRRSNPSFAPVIRLALVHHTGRRQRVHGGPVTLDRAGDRALPREGERLERHRLQLSRRPVQDRLRGSVRRHRPERRRRPRGGLQHRLGRRGGHGRVQLAAGLAAGTELAREAARLAPRPRSRRSRVDALVHLRWQRAVPRRAAGLPAHRLRTPGHGFHGLPGDRALQPAERDRR